MKSLLSLFVLILITIALPAQSKKEDTNDTCNFSIPNNLSVNGNDKLYASYNCDIKTFQFDLYNRWGLKVYSTDKLNKVLDFNIYETEKRDGKVQLKYPNSTYYWIAEYQFIKNGEMKKASKTGYIVITSSE